jgi:hypothetical protein
MLNVFVILSTLPAGRQEAKNPRKRCFTPFSMTEETFSKFVILSEAKNLKK